jgi:hypothetical protein
MGRHVGAGSIDVTTVRNALTDAARACGLPPHEIDTVLRDSSTSALSAGAAIPRHPDPLPEAPGVTVLDLKEDIETEFWDARPLLRHLHDFARARRVSPWAVLGVTLARVIVATPHQVCLPPIVGGKSSLNLFVGLVGPSGSGKGAAESVATDALHVGAIRTARIASGEAIAHVYKKRTKAGAEPDWRDDSHAALISVPEIDRLAGQAARQGATIMADLRSAWSGELLGQVAADSTRSIPLEAHQYRLSLVAGIQPARAGCLLDDSDGGTPQRFLWMPATDTEAPTMAPEEPPTRTWTAPSVSGLVGIGGAYMDVCDTARETILGARLAALRGEGDPLDGHALLARLKTAAALALLDRRLEVTGEDWRLGGIVAQKSAATRGRVVATLERAVREKSRKKAEAVAQEAVIVEERTTDVAVKRVCRVITRKLRRDEWMGTSAIRKALASRDRKYFDIALERLAEAGQIEVDEDATGHGNSTGKYRLRGDL